MKTVIEMARESTLLDSRDDWGSVPIEYEVAINTFAELVRADAIANEREACAKLADKVEYCGACESDVARAIRARSNT